MFYSFVDEIKNIRKENKISINNKNSNRYSIIVDEENSTQSAYCSSIPIYNLHSKKYVSRKFVSEASGFVYRGSNSVVNINENGFVLKNAEGIAEFDFPVTNIRECGYKLICSECEYYPTGNGIVVRSYTTEKPIIFHIHFDNKIYGLHTNSKCFSIMSDKFKPFFTISSIGIINDKGKICSQAVVTYQKGSHNDYAILIEPATKSYGSIMVEINLYEQKIVQDTTVDSKYPDENNAFGGTAYIGDSYTFGEQWLYLRPDISKIPYVHGKRIHKVNLYIPKLNISTQLLKVSQSARRFCSFGSTWDTKVESTTNDIEGENINDYVVFDISKYMITPQQKTLIQPEGLILKSAHNNQGFTAISTGDNFWRPQILEINYT